MRDIDMDATADQQPEPPFASGEVTVGSTKVPGSQVFVGTLRDRGFLIWTCVPAHYHRTRRAARKCAKQTPIHRATEN